MPLPREFPYSWLPFLPLRFFFFFNTEGGTWRMRGRGKSFFFTSCGQALKWRLADEIIAPLNSLAKWAMIFSRTVSLQRQTEHNLAIYNPIPNNGTIENASTDEIFWPQFAVTSTSCRYTNKRELPAVCGGWIARSVILSQVRCHFARHKQHDRRRCGKTSPPANPVVFLMTPNQFNHHGTHLRASR